MRKFQCSIRVRIVSIDIKLIILSLSNYIINIIPVMSNLFSHTLDIHNMPLPTKKIRKARKAQVYISNALRLEILIMIT